MFVNEADAWYGIPEFNVLEQNLTIPGFSPLFPDAHCTKDGSICQLITGEGEINAASTISALVHSDAFDLTHTHFLIAGIAGISPKLATIGSVTFRFGVQVGLQFELDAREKPDDFPTGFVPQGSQAPHQFPQTLYGTEVLEVNEDRQWAIKQAKNVTLADNELLRVLRANYASNPDFAVGAAPPSVVACDTATSDTFWTGTLLAEVFENTTSLFTNQTGTYCTTQQEDNATLQALLRGALSKKLQFSRIIIMRTGSDFDRLFDGENAATNLFSSSPGFDISLQNIHAAGAPIVTGIVLQWNLKTFEAGIKPSNYIGDIFGSLGGTPDFAPQTFHRRCYRCYQGQRHSRARRMYRSELSG